MKRLIISCAVICAITTSCYNYNNPLDPNNITIATPSFSPSGGTYNSIQTVSISCATSGVNIRYTTNGTDPTDSSTLYTTPLTISESMTLKAKAYKSDYKPSSTATSVYTIVLPPLITEHFNDLSQWTLSVSSQYDVDHGGVSYWELTDGYSTFGYSGTGAHGWASGYNGWTRMSRSFDIPTSAILKVWMKKTNGPDWPTTNSIIMEVDGNVAVDFNESSVNEWVQKQCCIPSGIHTISFYLDEQLGATVDELEIFAD